MEWNNYNHCLFAKFVIAMMVEIKIMYGSVFIYFCYCAVTFPRVLLLYATNVRAVESESP